MVRLPLKDALGLTVTEVPEIEVAPPETVRPAAVVRAAPETSRPLAASTLPLKLTWPEPLWAKLLLKAIGDSIYKP